MNEPTNTHRSLAEELQEDQRRYWEGREETAQVRDLQYIEGQQLARDVAGERLLHRKIEAEATDLRQFAGWLLATWGFFALLLGLAIMTSKTGLREKPRG